MPTFTEQYDVTDKSAWGEGPWDGEPDKVVWVDETTDLDCMIVRNRMGSLCGYVGVPDTHPFYGMQMLDTPILEVHGGITFADGCNEEGDRATSVCHIAQPGRPSEVWWLGFDCGHAWDYIPELEASMRGSGFGPASIIPDVKYRDINFVIDQCEALAAQVKEAEHGMGHS